MEHIARSAPGAPVCRPAARRWPSYRLAGYNRNRPLRKRAHFARFPGGVLPQNTAPRPGASLRSAVRHMLQWLMLETGRSGSNPDGPPPTTHPTAAERDRPNPGDGTTPAAQPKGVCGRAVLKSAHSRTAVAVGSADRVGRKAGKRLVTSARGRPGGKMVWWNSRAVMAERPIC